MEEGRVTVTVERERDGLMEGVGRGDSVKGGAAWGGWRGWRGCAVKGR